MRRYLRHLFGTILFVLACVALLNALIDPFSTGRWPAMDSFAPGREVQGRRSKSELVNRGDTQVLLLGSSRVEYGLNPGHPAFEGRVVSNVGLDRHCAAEMLPILEFALDSNDLEEVWICTDFFAFNRLRQFEGPYDPIAYQPQRALLSRQTVAVAHAESRFNADRPVWLHELQMYLGREATSESIKVIDRTVSGETNLYTSRGYRMKREVDETPEERFFMSLRSYLTWTSLYGTYEAGENHYAALDLMLARCEDRQVKVTIIMMPLHALHLEAIHAQGHWLAFEDWKRRVVTIAEDHPHPVAVWDFQGYDERSMEPVSIEGGETEWFWESSHCREAMGDLVIQTVAGADRQSTGIRLSTGNIDRHLESLQAARDAFIRQHPLQMAFFNTVLERCGLSELVASGAVE